MTVTRTRLLSPVSTLVAAVALTLALTSCGTDSTDASGGGASSGAAVGVQVFEERVEQPDVVVLDVRTPEEFAAGHLPDAINIDVSAADFASRVAALDQSATYAVYCRSGNRSGVAVDHMVEAGFSDVQHLDGGIIAWQSADGPLVTG